MSPCSDCSKNVGLKIDDVLTEIYHIHLASNNSNRETVDDDSYGDTSSARSQISSQQRVQTALDSLKSQHADLVKYFYTFSYPEANPPAAHPPALPSTAEETDAQPVVRIHSPLTRRSMRSSTDTSLPDTVNEWYDALDILGDSAQEFVMDGQASPEELEFGDKFLAHDSTSASSLEPPESFGETELEEDEVAAMVKYRTAESSDNALPITRRTQLAATQVSDEGSLFAILKNNVGKVGNLHDIAQAGWY